MIRVLIGDDHAIIRSGLKQILSEEKNSFFYGEAENGQSVLDKIQKEKWDIVVLDISMPGLSGIETLKEIKKLKPKLPVLVLTVHSEDQFALRSIKSGAAGYLKKDAAPDELITAIHKIVNGGKYINEQLAKLLADDFERDTDKPIHEILSDREYEVMLLIASGKTAKQIADELSLSIKTVSTYRTRLLDKMGLKSNAELTRYAIENKLA
jgi:two-component system invasion response regulator UvrY